MDRERGSDTGDHPDGPVCQMVLYLSKIIFDYLCFLRADQSTVAALDTNFLYNFGAGLDIVRIGVDTDSLQRA
ncbi:MAG: hypothetical protein BWY65_01611 [Firmicutes bacterium ADurb.Bin373]|nr:MAG: hypothetical protein BWY65_01611 [Firmicutes bacterium ADurb.Bin373]